jgi:hypothetical protein
MGAGKVISRTVGVFVTLLGAAVAPADATLPGPNGKLAFHSDRTGSLDLFVP